MKETGELHFPTVQDLLPLFAVMDATKLSTMVFHFTNAKAVVYCPRDSLGINGRYFSSLTAGINCSTS